ncbi:MAG TPA: hydantoinase B/oxoprolinase family protein [Pirellulales bacterium]|nr:hydantoinase B/oxoprolinase family protein [Pirellulales bacterium]
MTEFWIDVGGTFTDCFMRSPDGQLRRHKLLSSGIVKGAVAANSSQQRIVDPARSADPDGFWRGYELRLVDATGRRVAASQVAGFDRPSGTLELAEPLDAAPHADQAYELASPDEAPVMAIRWLLGLRLDEPIPPCVVRLGTTRGTNALLTRRGARTAFITTRGFGDILHIGYQNRPRLFDLTIRKPEPLFVAMVEIDERTTVDGQVLKAPDRAAVRQQLAALREQQIDSLAICLLHAYRFPEHEQMVEGIARELAFDEISTSSRVAPLVKIVSRGDTTVVDAYLNPVLRQYVQRLRRALPQAQLRLMTSAGGLVAAEQFVGKDSILSGPAGGVVGFSRVAQAVGFERAIGFDMGGTSTDVARFDARYELEYETEKAGVRVVAPMMAIHTVAAGGGSICAFDGVKLVVGPDSSGADPGPACYGRGGPLSVTDLNFYLGKILPDSFPFPLDRTAVGARLNALIDQIIAATGRRYSPHELCEGFLRVANANMVKAVQAISIAKGADPRDYVLVAFGGAAPQHACAVARELGIRQVLNHPDSGILSAYGIGLAEVSRHRAAGVYRPYSAETVAALRTTFDELAAPARDEVQAEGILATRIDVRELLDLRYRGLDAYLTIERPADGDWPAAYEAAHEKLYGYRHAGRELEIVAARVEVTGRTEQLAVPPLPMLDRKLEAQGQVTSWFDNEPSVTKLFTRSKLQPGDVITGPAIVREAISTTVIDPGWRARVLEYGELLIEHHDTKPQASVSTAADPVMLEVFNNQFAAIAEQMGITLRNTASSVNVKERLDFSCALFTSTGELVVNAPHIPVHLGAMSETVRRTLADNPDMAAGDVFVTNDPYRGGSHLPDVTVVTPVYDPQSGRLLFFTASRAHHAEIGGIRPGSLPPFSRNLAEEGVLIRNFKLLDRGQSRFEQLRDELLGAVYPTRNVADNLADLAAQAAANNQGARDLLRLVERYGWSVVEAYMRHIQAAAERKMRAALAKFPPGRYEFLDHLDDGSPICVAITIAPPAADGQQSAIAATIDFAGTGPVLPGNLNANRAIVTAAVMYSLRVLIDEDIPLNQGVLAAVRLVLPECLLRPPEGAMPETCPAVVGGNTETSQRVVDVLLGALGLAAASQGTMNNVVFGDATFGYYETICGGSGATAAGPGADAVQVHMTNTRLTDAEVLEQRWPVRVLEFSIRRGSGGAGVHRGGDGIVRRLEFLRALEVSILSQRRGPWAPYGQAGGQPGALGRNWLRRADGSIETLKYGDQFQSQPGDQLIIETPGGGGWGAP